MRPNGLLEIPTVENGFLQSAQRPKKMCIKPCLT